MHMAEFLAESAVGKARVKPTVRFGNGRLGPTLLLTDLAGGTQGGTWARPTARRRRRAT